MSEQLLDQPAADIDTFEDLREAVQEFGFDAVMAGILNIDKAEAID